MPSFTSPFQRLHQLAEQCFGHLESDFHPRTVWQVDDPERLAQILQTLIGTIDGLELGLQRIAADADDGFTGVMELEEWAAVEDEAPGWKRSIGRLRPSANATHVKEELLGIRVRISELVDGLVVRSAVRDPANRAGNSQEAVRSVARLQKERGLRQLALNLLEGVTWQDTLKGSVADWSTSFGPQHRIELGRLCELLLNGLRPLTTLSGAGTTVRRLVQSTAGLRDRIEAWHIRLSKIPLTRVDAGTSSDLHYLAELAQQVIKAVADDRQAILNDYAGRELPSAITDFFQQLHLKVPKTQKKIVRGPSHPTTREDLERELGRRIAGPASEQDRADSI